MALLSFLLSTLIFLSHPFATIFSLGAIPLLPSQAVTEITQSTPDLRWVISQVSPAVVRVRSGFKVLRGELLYDTGTGFFISQEYILTNNHVVGDDKYVLVTVYDINFRSIDLKGEVIFKDQIGDLALVQVPQQKDQTYLHLSDSLPYAGTPVVALGFAFNSWTASTGHITCGTFSENITNRSKGFIEKTDAAINPGNSGGPLIDVKTNQVVGMNSSILLGGNNVGYAIPSVALADFVNKAQHNQIPQYQYFGIRFETLNSLNWQMMCEALSLACHDTTGLVVTWVDPKSPAFVGGVMEGDILVSWNEMAIQTEEDLYPKLIGKPGSIKLKVKRDGKDIILSITTVPFSESRFGVY